MAELTLTVTNRAISLPQSTPQQITNTEYIDKVKFNCDADFDNYTLVAIFRNGKNGACYPAAVPADRSAVDIDPRALRRKGYLYIGMYGLNGLKVLPTLWAPPIEIKEGVDTSATESPETPVPSIYAALVARVGALEDDVDEIADDVEQLAADVDAVEAEVDGIAEDVETLETEVEGKQDVITDLDTIRSGAAAGATALQSVPMSTSNTIGGVKVYPQTGWDGYGIKINSNGYIYVTRANDSTIEQRTNEYNPIVPKTIDKAVSAALCNPIREYTDEQKAAACATIGAEYKGVDNWELVAELDREQTAFAVNLEGYTELMISSAIEGNATTHLLYNNGKLLINSVGVNGKRAVKAIYKNCGWGGFAPTVCTRAAAIDNPTDCICDMGMAYGRMDNFIISDITNIYLSNTPTVYAHVGIYAR